MKITRIDPMSLAKVSAVVGLIMGFIYGVIYFLAMSAVGSLMGILGTSAGGIMPGLGALALIGFPIMYAIGGFIGGLISAVVYNFAAKQVGGVNITLKK